ncbi:MAG: TIGR03986 family CRISPR-associated RAMP protein, partial [Acidobacteriota bacterium]
LRVRTAIDRDSRRAKDEQLFAYEMVVPDGLCWAGKADLSRIDPKDRVAVLRDLAGLLAEPVQGLGKGKASFRMRLLQQPVASTHTSNAQPRDGCWILTLQTPAILCDPRDVDKGGHSSEALRDSYRSAFKDLSENSLRLERFFARQSLAGGYYLRMRFQEGRAYVPYLLTDPGSVFVLCPGAFELDGRPAIPASSVRGMISSLAEAASNSALRILENRAYSYRMAMPGLSAIGMVVTRNGQAGDTEYRLRPLSLPTLEDRARNGLFSGDSWCEKIFPRPNFKVYGGQPHEIRNSGFPYRTFLKGHPRYYGLKLAPAKPEWSNGAVRVSPGAYWIKRGRFLLARQSEGRPAQPVPWEEIPDNEKPAYTRGIMRVLGCWGRPDIPSTKKHEIFIPYTTDMAEWETFPIIEEAVVRFHELADERTQASKDGPLLPYEPRDTPRTLDPEQPKDFRLKDGDLVYFRANREGTEVIAVALSSIWRCRVEAHEGDGAGAARAFDFFRDIDPELVPFCESRERITPAEQLFGFVEERFEGESGRVGSSLALAGRLRFSHALLEGVEEQDFSDWNCRDSTRSPYLGETTLKILGAPKPPSPSLYFKWKSARGGPVAKAALNLLAHRPQGRKFYLHQRQENEPWRSRLTNRQEQGKNARLKQKVEIRPIRKGASFTFHLDFENLTRRELALLSYALRPTDGFRHKIGMGKPIGLGTVRIAPLGLYLIDRSRRYTLDGFMSGRFQSCWENPATDENKRPGKDEAAAEPSAPSLTGLASEYRSTMNGQIRDALEMLGDPGLIKSKTPVHYPTVKENGAFNLELDLFEWFVANDELEGRGECLVPLKEGTRELPALRYLERKKGKGQGKDGKGPRNPPRYR